MSRPARLVRLLAGTLVAATVGCGSSPHRPSAPVVPAATTALAAQRFLEAWQRDLTTSWGVVETVDRTTRLGGHIAFPVRRAQRPPDHLNTGLGTVDARFGDRQVACGLGTSDVLQCAQQPGAPPYSKVVADQLATLRTYVVGSTAIYAAAQLGGCFELRLRLASFPVPPYGKVAVFCFDPATGAPAGSVIARDEGTDRTIVTAAHNPATDADLRLPSSQEVASVAQSVRKAATGR